LPSARSSSVESVCKKVCSGGRLRTHTNSCELRTSRAGGPNRASPVRAVATGCRHRKTRRYSSTCAVRECPWTWPVAFGGRSVEELAVANEARRLWREIHLITPARQA